MFLYKVEFGPGLVIINKLFTYMNVHWYWNVLKDLGPLLGNSRTYNFPVQGTPVKTTGKPLHHPDSSKTTPTASPRSPGPTLPIENNWPSGTRPIIDTQETAGPRCQENQGAPKRPATAHFTSSLTPGNRLLAAKASDVSKGPKSRFSCQIFRFLNICNNLIFFLSLRFKRSGSQIQPFS